MELLTYSLILQSSMALYFVIGGASLLVGAGAAFFLVKTIVKGKSNKLLTEAESEAEMIKQQKILQAKEKFLQLKEEHEKLINEKNSKLNQRENEVRQIELSTNQKQEDIQRNKKETESIRENLNAQLEIIEKKKDELERSHRIQVEQLEAISGLSAEEAKAQLVESLKEEAKTEAMSLINEIVDEAKMTANKEAKNIVIKTIQRVASETAIENAVTVFHIESDELKGRIIGREGRNIRALEAATGVEVIVDDTPEAIILSASASAFFI